VNEEEEVRVMTEQVEVMSQRKTADTGPVVEIGVVAVVVAGIGVVEIGTETVAAGIDE